MRTWKNARCKIRNGYCKYQTSRVMVGNDIVDINEAKSASNWQRPRFLEKLFTTKEQFTIRNAETPF